MITIGTRIPHKPGERVMIRVGEMGEAGYRQPVVVIGPGTRRGWRESFMQVHGRRPNRAETSASMRQPVFYYLATTD